MSGDIVDISSWVVPRNSFPGNQADPWSVFSLSWNCQLQAAEQSLQSRGAQGDSLSRIKVLEVQCPNLAGEGLSRSLVLSPRVREYRVRLPHTHMCRHVPTKLFSLTHNLLSQNRNTWRFNHSSWPTSSSQGHAGWS